MKKVLASIVATAAMLIGASAQAAPVDIFVTQRSADPSQWDVTVNVESGTSAGGFALLLGGATNIVLGPGFNVSLLDSVLDPTGSITGQAQLNLNAPAGGTLATGPATGLLVATLTLNPGGTVSPGDDYFGYTVVDETLSNVVGYSLTIVPVPVPEPASLVLLGLGLAGLALARRSA